MKGVSRLALGAAGCFALLACGLSAAGAADTAETPATDDAQHYIGILGTFGKPDKDREQSSADIKHSAGGALLYGWQSPDRWGFEIQAFDEVLETGKSIRTDYYRYGANGDFVYSFGDRKSFTPFALIGVGGNFDDIFPGHDKTDVFGNAGIGFVTAPVTKRGQIRIRGEVRYIYDNFKSGYNDFRAGLGIEIPLFLPAPPAVPAPPPEPVQVVQTVKEVERVEVPVPTGVLDSDGDGVVDSADKCPGTPPNTRVDGDGCPLEKVIVLKGVTFEFNKTRLRPDALTILDGAVAILKKYPDMKVEVAGHTDNVGSDSYNLKLSEGRAIAVRDYFVSQGVAADSLTTKGYGESEPITDNATEEGRERNRRVELRILN